MKEIDGERYWRVPPPGSPQPLPSPFIVFLRYLFLLAFGVSVVLLLQMIK
jgi:hypothetical protein